MATQSWPGSKPLAGQANQRDGARLLYRLHENDGGAGVEQYPQAASEASANFFSSVNWFRGFGLPCQKGGTLVDSGSAPTEHIPIGQGLSKDGEPCIRAEGRPADGEETRNHRNNRSRVRGALRQDARGGSRSDKKAAEQQFRETVSALDKAIQKGVLHKNTAGRYKSRLSARVQSIK